MRTTLIFTLAMVGYALAGQAPRFSIITDNGQVSSDSLLGKVIYLDFWASWCEPCRESFPWMNDLHETYADSGLVVIAVNLDRDRAKVEKFLAKTPAGFTIGYDPQGEFAKSFGVKGMPSTYLIDRHGQLVMSHVGFREKDKEELRTQIETALHSH